ncbi:MAG: hypothetical protein RJB38_1858 [Pseudomonadota bacterium]|jgi:hypothetical protein
MMLRFIRKTKKILRFARTLAPIFLVSQAFAFAMPERTATAAEPETQQAGKTLERYTGIARDRQGKLLYREKHEVEYLDQQVKKAVSEYLSPDGNLVARLKSEFPSPTSFLPKYQFENLQAQIQEGVDCCSGSSLEVYHSRKGKTERTRLDFAPNWVSGQGFHYLARERLGEVARGEGQEFKFLIPSKMSAYNFRIRSGGKDPTNLNYQKVLLEIDQWFFRLFAPKIIATYDTKTKRLMKYQGPSNLEATNGDVPEVTIDYTYE